MSDRDFWRIAREVTDDVLGPGTYASIHRGNPDPRVREQVRMSLDPPNPIPEHLFPGPRVPLGSDDLRAVPSTAELRTIAKLLDHFHLAGFTMVTQRDGSPWLEVDVAVPFHFEAREFVRQEVDDLPAPADGLAGLGPGGVHKFAIWRYTGKAYRCDMHGAVEDDPIEL
jgi:hypothetical protein